MIIHHIRIPHLTKSPHNVRKVTTGLDDLKASILAHGLMHNLVATDAGEREYHVIDGGRRLAAIQELVAEGKLPADHSVPCQIVTDEQAQEMSLAANTVRSAMHPADEFEAFAALAAKKRTAEEIALNFGVTAKHVEQRLKLGRVAPELLAAYRAEELTLESLMAFTITDDRTRQVKVWKGLQGWQKDNPREIREALTEKMVDADDKLVKFVTLEAYQAAGGKTRADLFEDETYLEDPELLNRLAGAKLDAARQELEAEGWGWVEVNPERDYSVISRCGRIEPKPVDAPAELLEELEKAEAEQTRIAELIDAAHDEEDFDEAKMEVLEAQDTAIGQKLEQIEERLGSFVAYDPEQKKLAGCYISIGYRGELSIERGLVRKEDQKKLAKPQGAGGEATASEKPKGLSQSLLRDLEAYRLGAAQAEIAKNPSIAFDLLVFKAAKSRCGLNHAYDGPQVSFTGSYGGTASSDAREFIAERMKPIKASLTLDWLEIDNEVGQFATFQALTTEQKHAILAYCVASTLQPKLHPKAEPDDDRRTAHDIALAQTGGDVAEYWRPTKDNYLSRISKDQLLEIGAEVAGSGWASHRRNSKKTALADELHQAFAAPDEHGKTPEQIERLKNWLPEGMAFGTVPQPEKPAKAKKARKAA